MKFHTPASDFQPRKMDLTSATMSQLINTGQGSITTLKLKWCFPFWSFHCLKPLPSITRLYSFDIFSNEGSLTIFSSSHDNYPFSQTTVMVFPTYFIHKPEKPLWNSGYEELSGACSSCENTSIKPSFQ